MKPKVHGQVQPRDVVPRDAQVRLEIQNFLLALESYPSHAAKQPRISFHQHLCGIVASRDDRRGKRTSGH
jgi:hypothetical protein